MVIPVQNFWQKNAIFFSMMLMVLAMFVSRAFFSISTIVFIAACCLSKYFLLQAKTWLRTPLLVAISALFFIPLVSGLWSTDTTEWMNILRVKLPLLLFPLAFAGAWQMSRQQWKFVFMLVLVTALAGSAYSFIGYLTNQNAAHEAYLQAKVINTPFQNDHLRFSLFIAIAYLCSLYLVEHGYKALRTIGFCLAVWFAIYLHVLSARTGLICIYIITLIYLARLIFGGSGSRYKIALIMATIALPFIAWFLFPTFQNRIRYFLYDHSFIKTSTYLPGSNDGNRIMSLKAGWNILWENPGGVGAGDVKPKADEWYAKHVPQMLESDKLYPSSEWLMHGDMAGWVGAALFSAIMLFPFFLSMRHRLFWIMLNTAIITSLLFDTGLGVQYGVFLYAFFILAFWKWSAKDQQVADNF